MIGKELEQPKARFALTNGRVILPEAIVVDKAVVVEGYRLLDIADRAALSSEVQTVDVGGRYITPGLIDIHIHGAVGHTFNEPTAEAFAAITEETATRGLTALVATVVTAAIPDTVECLNFSREWMREERLLAAEESGE